MDPGGERTYLHRDPNDSFEEESNRLGHQVSGKKKMIELWTAVRIYELMHDAEVNMITEGDSEEREATS